MNARIVCTFVLSGALALALGGAARAAGDEDIAKAKKAATEHLAGLKGDAGVVTHIKDDTLDKALPDVICFSVLFRQYPVGRVPPEGLKASNVFVVDKDGKVKVITDTKGLEEFFKAKVTAKEEAKAKEAVVAWSRLSQEFVQDGFYKFKLMDDATKVKDEKDTKVATCTTAVMQGGSGMIVSTLTFDDKGKLTKGADDVQVKPGPRPICQATKLLDADPIVRRIAEQDLLIMGRAAKPYLDEQRAKASPELQNAIDRLWERIEKDDR
jgi:hypothetical protein